MLFAQPEDFADYGDEVVAFGMRGLLAKLRNGTVSDFVDDASGKGLDGLLLFVSE
jgi:hypothetical protein